MATVRDIVTAALKKVNVTDVSAAPAAEDAARGLELLNYMLSGWKLFGVDVTHTDLELSDTFPLADEFREGTVYVLASRLSDDYAIPPTFDADAWFRGIQAAYLTINAATMPAPLTRMPSNYWPRHGYR